MDVKLPRLGEGAESGIVATIFVREGDSVKKDQPILELESEKAVASIPSPLTGKITKIHVKEGDEIRVGQLILTLSGDGATVSPSTSPKQTIDASVVDEAGEREGSEGEGGLLGTTVVSEELPEDQPGKSLHPGIPPPASPSIRKLARELGIDLTKVRGSQRGGRIVLADLKRHILRLQQAAPQPKSAPGASAEVRPPVPFHEPIDFSKWGPVTVKKMTNLRKTISARMVDSWTSIPHITQFDEADITSLLELRKKYSPRYEKKGAHLTLTSFALKVVARVLKNFPRFNASIDELSGDIILKSYFHIGIAVDTDQGLIVPVIRDVDKKGLLELSVELQELAKRTRKRKVSLEEMQGGTFTISNQGGIGSGHFTPIINKPELAILGLGRGVAKPVVRRGKIEKRTMLPVSLSYDHRLIDGADAARCMVEIVQALENFKDSDVKI